MRPLLEAHQIGLENGDFEYSAIAAHSYCHQRFLLGDELGEVAEELLRTNDSISKIKQDVQLVWNKIGLQGIVNLQGRSTERICLAGEYLDETEALPELTKKNDRTGICVLYYMKTLLSCLFQQYERTVEYLDSGVEYRSSVTGLFASTRFCFFESIARLRVCAKARAGDRRRHLRKVAANQRKFKRWVRFAPFNHLHVYELVEAERCRVAGRIKKARQHYARAIAAAGESRFLHEEALAHELAGQFYLEQGDRIRAQSHLHQARYSYLKWGAMAKVADMDERHGALLAKAVSKAAHMPSVADTVSASKSIPTVQATTRWNSSSAELDLSSVIKASQGISGEIGLDSLIETMMQILIETAGAQKGALILQEQETGTVEALIEAGEAPRFRKVATALDSCEEVSSTIVRFVLRCGENVVLGDASLRGDYVGDLYLQKAKVKSVLCCPIQRHGRIMGALYLENNQAVDAFTPRRVELLGMLASQAAISLENARLFLELNKALEQAHESMRVKNEFLARTSHELRTPLNHLINIPEGIRDHIVDLPTWKCASCQSRFELEGRAGAEPGQKDCPCPACGERSTLIKEEVCNYTGDLREARQLLDEVAQSGKQLSRLISNILDTSELENKQTQLTIERVPVDELLSRVGVLVRPLAEKHGVQVFFPEVPAELTLPGDFLKLGQVIYNLLDNAIKFSPQGGQVELEVTIQEGTVCFSIKDRGIGIDSAGQGRIFESFRQVEEGTKRRFGGAGLGLSIAKNLVELHEGRIWVESELGKGSTFHVELPRHPAPHSSLFLPASSILHEPEASSG